MKKSNPVIRQYIDYYDELYWVTERLSETTGRVGNAYRKAYKLNYNFALEFEKKERYKVFDIEKGDYIDAFYLMPKIVKKKKVNNEKNYMQVYNYLKYLRSSKNQELQALYDKFNVPYDYECLEYFNWDAGDADEIKGYVDGLENDLDAEENTIEERIIILEKMKKEYSRMSDTYKFDHRESIVFINQYYNELVEYQKMLKSKSVDKELPLVINNRPDETDNARNPVHQQKSARKFIPFGGIQMAQLIRFEELKKTGNYATATEIYEIIADEFDTFPVNVKSNIHRAQKRQEENKKLLNKDKEK